MSKTIKIIAILTVFLSLVTVAGLFMKAPVDTKPPVKELKVGGMQIRFEEGFPNRKLKLFLKNAILLCIA